MDPLGTISLPKLCSVAEVSLFEAESRTNRRCMSSSMFIFPQQALANSSKQRIVRSFISVYASLGVIAEDEKLISVMFSDGSERDTAAANNWISRNIGTVLIADLTGGLDEIACISRDKVCPTIVEVDGNECIFVEGDGIESDISVERADKIRKMCRAAAVSKLFGAFAPISHMENVALDKVNTIASAFMGKETVLPITQDDLDIYKDGYASRCEDGLYANACAWLVGCYLISGIEKIYPILQMRDEIQKAMDMWNSMLGNYGLPLSFANDMNAENLSPNAIKNISYALGIDDTLRAHFEGGVPIEDLLA